jgi:hypothetical protein
MEFHLFILKQVLRVFIKLFPGMFRVSAGRLQSAFHTRGEGGGKGKQMRTKTAQHSRETKCWKVKM